MLATGELSISVLLIISTKGGEGTPWTRSHFTYISSASSTWGAPPSTPSETPSCLPPPLLHGLGAGSSSSSTFQQGFSWPQEGSVIIPATSTTCSWEKRKGTGKGYFCVKTLQGSAEQALLKSTSAESKNPMPWLEEGMCLLRSATVTFL